MVRKTISRWLPFARASRHGTSVPRSTQSLLRQIEGAVAAETGAGYLTALATHLAARLHTDYAFIAAPDEANPDQLVTLAAYGDGVVAANLAFCFEGTPWERVLRQGRYACATGLRESFPEDLLLQHMCIEGFAGTCVLSGAGQPVGVVGVMHRSPLHRPEVAEAILRGLAPRTASEIGRLRADEALHSSEEKLSKIFSASPDAITLSSLGEGRYLDVNEGFTRMFGYERWDAIGRSATELELWRRPSERTQLLAALVEQGSVRNLEAELVSRDERVITCLISADVIELQGRACMLAVTRDITDRTSAETALRASERRYRTLFEESQALNFVIGRDGLLLDVNDAVVRTFGLGRDELIGLSALDFIDVDDHAGVLSAIESLFGGGAAVPCHIQVRSGDRQRRLMLAFGGLDQSGEAPSLLVNALDVTEWHRAARDRARLEEQVRQSQKMEAIGRLAGGIAHDFNNILQLIEGHLSVAIEQLPLGSGPSSSISAAMKTVARAAALSRQLLTFSSREAVSAGALDLAEELGDLASLMQGVIGDHITLDLTTEPHLPAVRIDLTQLEQIMLNLCINARDAMPSGGRIAIAAKRAEVSADFCAAHPGAREGTYVCVSVVDSGSGIPPELLQRIFEPFFTTKATGRGTGLGLATVYGIVQRLRGFVDVSSEMDVGTSMRVYLPLAGGPPTLDVTPDSERQSHYGSELILVVEADRAVRDLVCASLERGGFRTLPAADGEEALAHLKVRSDEISLAVIDAVIPNMAGNALFQILGQVRPSLPILFTSGYNDHPAQSDTKGAGRHPLILKPYAPAELLHRVRHLLDNARGDTNGRRRGLIDDPRR